jgi:hypothetical protein
LLLFFFDECCCERLVVVVFVAFFFEFELFAVVFVFLVVAKDVPVPGGLLFSLELLSKEDEDDPCVATVMLLMLLTLPSNEYEDDMDCDAILLDR